MTAYLLTWMWTWICVSIATSATALSRLSMIEARLCSEMVDDLNMFMTVLLKRGANHISRRLYRGVSWQVTWFTRYKGHLLEPQPGLHYVHISRMGILWAAKRSAGLSAQEGGKIEGVMLGPAEGAMVILVLQVFWVLLSDLEAFAHLAALAGRLRILALSSLLVWPWRWWPQRWRYFNQNNWGPYKGKVQRSRQAERSCLTERSGLQLPWCFQQLQQFSDAERSSEQPSFQP